MLASSKRFLLLVIIIIVVVVNSTYYAMYWRRELITSRKLRIAISSDITTVDIGYAISVADFEVLGKVFESLFRVDYDPIEKKLVYIPWLVENYVVVNDTYWVFTLRKGVRFHNGEHLTAWDVEASIRRAMDFGPIGRMLLRNAQGEPIIEDVVVYNASVFALKLKQPFTPLVEHLAHLATAIMPRSLVEKYRGNRIGVENLTDVVGTGPFKLVEYVRGQYIKLARFDEYWRGKLGVEDLMYLIIPDPSARIASLRTGEADVIIGVPPDMVSQLIHEGFRVYNETGVRFVIVGINTQRISDVRIRQAMNYAINRKTIVEKVMNGFAIVADSVASPVFPRVVKLEPYGYDVEKARKLIEDVGGLSRSLTLLVSTRSPKDIELAQIVQNYLSTIGIDVEIQPMEHTAFLKKVFQDHDFDLAIYGPSPSSLYYALTYWRTGAALNAPLYSNPEVDKLLDEIAVERDEQRLQHLYRTVQEIIWSECPAIWLYFENILVATRPGVEGLKIMPFQMLILDNVCIIG